MGSTRHGGGPAVKSLLITLIAVVVLFLHGTSDSACVKSLAWGMLL